MPRSLFNAQASIWLTLFYTWRYFNASTDIVLTFMEPKSTKSDLYFVGEFNISNVFLLSDTVLLHHWFLALFHQNNYDYFSWFHLISAKIHLYVEAMLSSVYIWFDEANYKPPDKKNLSTNQVILLIFSSFNLIIELIKDFQLYFGSYIDLYGIINDAFF